MLDKFLVGHLVMLGFGVVMGVVAIVFLGA